MTDITTPKYLSSVTGTFQPPPQPPSAVMTISGLMIIILILIGIVIGVFTLTALGLSIGALVQAMRNRDRIQRIKDTEIIFKGYPHKDSSADISGEIDFQCHKERIVYTLNYDVLSGYGVNGFFLWNHISDLNVVLNPLRIIKLCKANPGDVAGFPGLDTPICPAGDPDCVGSCKYSGTLSVKREISKALCYDIFRNILNYNLAINNTNVNFAALSALDKTLI